MTTVLWILAILAIFFWGYFIGWYSKSLFKTYGIIHFSKDDSGSFIASLDRSTKNLKKGQLITLIVDK